MASSFDSLDHITITRRHRQRQQKAQRDLRSLVVVLLAHVAHLAARELPPDHLQDQPRPVQVQEVQHAEERPEVRVVRLRVDVVWECNSDDRALEAAQDDDARVDEDPQDDPREREDDEPGGRGGLAAGVARELCSFSQWQWGWGWC